MKSSEKYDSLFQFFGGEQGIDPLLLKAQVRAGSNFDRTAVSLAGAKGLAQFMPRTWGWAQELRWVPLNADPFDPEYSIQAQARYMRFLLNLFRGDEDLALAGYRWGQGNVEKVRHDKDWRLRLPRETKAYLKRIKQFRQEYFFNKEGS